MLPAFFLISLIPLASAQSPAGNQSPNPVLEPIEVDTSLDDIHGSPSGNQSPNPVPEPEPAAPIVIDPNNVQFQDGIDPNNLSPPVREPESTPGNLYVCTDKEFGGDCEYFHALTYNCYNLADKFKHKLTSIRPDKNQMCQFYEYDNCVGNSDWIRWPGSGNMRGRRFDNKAASWTCSDDNCDGVQGPGGCTKNADGSLKGADPVGDAAKGWDTTRG